MGEIADTILDQILDPDPNYPAPEHYLDMSDEELRKATAPARSPKIKGIRAWPNKLTDKQRYCLAAWLAERDARFI